MFQHGASYDATNKVDRIEALTALGQAVATRPWNMEKIEIACQAIRDSVEDDTLAEGLVLEACLTAACFEKMTKLVDGTMRKPHLAPIAGILWMIEIIGRAIRFFCCCRCFMRG